MKKVIIFILILFIIPFSLFANRVELKNEYPIDGGYRIDFYIDELKEHFLTVKDTKVFITSMSESQRVYLHELLYNFWLDNPNGFNSDEEKAKAIYSRIEEVYDFNKRFFSESIVLSSSFQLYNVDYFLTKNSIRRTEVNYSTNMSTSLDVSYRKGLSESFQLGGTLGLSFISDYNESFINVPTLIDFIYCKDSLVSTLSIGGLITVNENSFSYIPSTKLSVGYRTTSKEDIQLEIKSSILVGVWLGNTNATKSLVLTEIRPIEISFIKTF